MMRIMMITAMRTTLSVDDDLLAAAKLQAARLNTSLSEVINRALRRGLSEAPATRLREGGTIAYGDPAAPTLTSDQVRQLERRLDDDYLLGKLDGGR